MQSPSENRIVRPHAAFSRFFNSRNSPTVPAVEKALRPCLRPKSAVFGSALTDRGIAAFRGGGPASTTSAGRIWCNFAITPSAGANQHRRISPFGPRFSPNCLGNREKHSPESPGTGIALEYIDHRAVKWTRPPTRFRRRFRVEGTGRRPASWAPGGSAPHPSSDSSPGPMTVPGESGSGRDVLDNSGQP